MGFIAWLLVGGIAGWLAGVIMKGKGQGLLMNIVVGIVGGAIGGWIFKLAAVHRLPMGKHQASTQVTAHVKHELAAQLRPTIHCSFKHAPSKSQHTAVQDVQGHVITMSLLCMSRALSLV